MNLSNEKDKLELDKPPCAAVDTMMTYFEATTLAELPLQVSLNNSKPMRKPRFCRVKENNLVVLDRLDPEPTAPGQVQCVVKYVNMFPSSTPGSGGGAQSIPQSLVFIAEDIEAIKSRYF